MRKIFEMSILMSQMKSSGRVILREIELEQWGNEQMRLIIMSAVVNKSLGDIIP